MALAMAMSEPGRNVSTLSAEAEVRVVMVVTS